MNNYDVLFSQSRPMDNICYVHGQLHYKKHLNEVSGQNESYIEKYKNNLPLVLGFYVNEVKGYDFLEYQKFFQRTHILNGKEIIRLCKNCRCLLVNAVYHRVKRSRIGISLFHDSLYLS